MRILVILFLFNLFSFGLFSQTKVDTALLQLKGKSDFDLAHILEDSAYNYQFSDFKLSVAYANKAIEFAQKSKNQIELANAYNTIGICNHLQTNYKEAFENYVKALNIFRAINNSHGLTSTYINMGILYNDRKDTKTSLYYYRKAQSTAKGKSELPNLASVYNNIGALFQKMKQLDSAVLYYQASLEIRKKLGKPDRIATSLANIGTVYFDKKQYEKALEYHLLALHYDSLANDESALTLTMTNLGSSYESLQNYPKALFYTDAAYQLARKLNYVQQLPDIYRSYIVLYKSLKDFEKASFYSDEYIRVKDSLTNDETQRVITEMQSKYDSELKESEIKVLNKENEVKQDRIDQQTRFTYFMVAMILLLIIVAFVSYRAYVHKKETNKVISAQYKELVLQKKEIQEQRDIITEQNHKLEEVLKEIHQSIDYAQRIQSAILPPIDLIANYLKNFFLLFLPRNVVSGDFYYYTNINLDEFVVAVADCTGHGVPGALMSMVGNDQLNLIMSERRHAPAGVILDELHRGVRSTLQQEKNQTRDGMDIILCKVNMPAKRIEYAGANRNLWILRKENDQFQVIELSTNRQPIGGLDSISRKPFDTLHFQADSGDRVYLFSDGLADQFGGPSSKKLMVKNLRHFLLETASLSLPEQKEALHAYFVNWKGEQEQTDDVCMFAFQID